MRGIFLILIGILLVVRLPSLVQPAGADQGLYAYVGQRILAGEFPYRDAWDQKPPAIHYTYAALFGLWPDESVVAAADLTITAGVAWLLVAIGRRITGRAGAGEVAAVLFLLLGNPAFTRLGGVRVRGQCETFIAFAVAAALFLLIRPASQSPAGSNPASTPRLPLLAAGALLGLACLYKYNAIVYVPAALATFMLWQQGRALRARELLLLAAGFVVPLLATLLVFAAGGALADLYHATITYNLRYSGETYRSAAHFVGYLLTFPVLQARVDGLWLLGGLGCAVLLVAARRHPAALVGPVWVAAACASIALNGSRGLPQYFVQAAPALALAAGLAGVLVWPALRPMARAALAVLLAVAVLRVSDFGKPIEYMRHDLLYLSGDMGRESYLARFGGQRTEDKYSAQAVSELADYLRNRTNPDERVFVFGFSPGAYVQAGRQSASRFFWSRPVILEFNAEQPDYGPAGLLADLEANRPVVVALQLHDWAPDVTDSAPWFMSHPNLSAWLRAHYLKDATLDEYAVWLRKPDRQLIDSGPNDPLDLPGISVHAPGP
jgi:4-amino-4-deoxy-L-arabinose transferase-like glycosyltransferase